jgi:two-component system cell cycle sensor histidine kinase/response regulator CckA
VEHEEQVARPQETTPQRSDQIGDSYRALGEASPDGITISDPAGSLVYASPRAVSLFGCSSLEEALSTNVMDWVDPEDRERAARNWAALSRSEPLVSPGEYRMVRKDGTRFLCGISTAVLRNADGTLRGILATHRDISDRKRAEETLRASEERFRRMFQHSAAGMVLVSPNSCFLQVNEAFCNMLGYTESELMGKTFQNVTLPEDRPVSGELTRRVISGETEMFHFEKRYLRKNGTVVWGLVSSTLIRDAQNKPIHFVTLIQDITERKRAEQALRESEEKHRILLEESPDPIFSFTPEGQYRYVNRAFASGVGKQVEEIAGRTIWDVFPKREADKRFASLTQVFRTGKEAVIEVRVPRADGDRHYLTTITPIKDTAGKVVSAICSSKEITERKRAEEERTKLQLQLAHAQKMESIGRLASGVAHDFNNLLTVINGYSGLLLQKTPLGDPWFDGLTEIQRAGERAATLVRQLLAFSRKQALQPEILDLNATVRDLEKMLRRLVGEDVEVVVRLDPTAAPVLADRHQTEQVIMNLAVNALDAMPGGGTLTLETGQRRLEGVCGTCQQPIHPGTYTELTVRDTGTGMDQHTLEHLFEPFFTTKEVGKGTGLGLSTVQGIVIQSGGHVGVESEAGEGSAFHVYLPVAKFPAAEPCAVPVADSVGGTETILLVEDQKEVLKFVAMVLAKYGYKVVQAQDPEEALRVCAVQPVDLLVTDVVMPKMSGVELARHLRPSLPGLKAVFISGYSEATHEREWASLEGANFLQKPFAPRALAAKVREVLDRR